MKLCTWYLFCDRDRSDRFIDWFVKILEIFHCQVCPRSTDQTAQPILIKFSQNVCLYMKLCTWYFFCDRDRSDGFIDWFVKIFQCQICPRSTDQTAQPILIKFSQNVCLYLKLCTSVFSLQSGSICWIYRLICGNLRNPSLSNLSALHRPNTSTDFDQLFTEC